MEKLYIALMTGEIIASTFAAGFLYERLWMIGKSKN